jgi:hypothetical protein
VNDYALLAADICARYRLPARITSVARVLKVKFVDPGWVYGTHHAAADFWPMTRLRNDLDALLHAVSAMRVGGQPGDEPYESCGSDARIVVGILKHPKISDYYIHHYGIPNAALVVAEADGVASHRHEPRDEEWLNLYLRFLTLDAQVGANQPLRRALNLLDGGVVEGVSLTDLDAVLGSPDEIARWLQSVPHAEALEGLQDLLEFAGELHGLLTDLGQRPIMRGLVWLHFAHWLVHRCDQLIGVTEWAVGICDQAAHAEKIWFDMPGATGSSLGPEAALAGVAPRDIRQMVIELIDPNNFPYAFFEIAGPALKEWLAYVAWRHWHHGASARPLLTT